MAAWMQAIAGATMGFVLLLVLFRALEWTRPKVARKPLLRRGFLTDIGWFGFTAIVTKAFSRFGVAVVILPAALLIYGKLDPELIRNGYGPLSRLPLWLQAVCILVISDYAGYWMHRKFHGARLWNYHAVHHSSADLDWLSAVRVHPVNDLLMKVANAVPLVLLGFAPLAVASILPFLTLMAIMVHANLDWDWGPFRRILASPRFHRWHHTDELEARDKNFAGLFPVWDIIHGTWYMPRDKLPSVFGTQTPVPKSFAGQLAFPFRVGKPRAFRRWPLSFQQTRESKTPGKKKW